LLILQVTRRWSVSSPKQTTAILFSLFTLTTADANLMAANVTAWLTDHSVTADIVRCAGVNALMTVTFRSCRITMASGLSEIYYIGKNLATLRFNRCTIYNITTNKSAKPFMFCVQIGTLWVESSSFAFVHDRGRRIR
jgi:hypothetical protein